MKSGSKPEDPCFCSPDQGFYRTASLKEAVIHFRHCLVCQQYHDLASFTGKENPGLVILIERFGKETVLAAFTEASRPPSQGENS